MGKSSRPSILLIIVALGGAALVAGAGPAAAQETVVSAGFNVRFVSGSFGSDQTTRLVYAPAVLRVDTGRFELAGYFPYLTIDDGTVALSQAGFVPMRGTVTGSPAVGMPMGPGGVMGGGMMGGSSAQFTQTGATVPITTDVLLTNQSGPGDVVASAGYRVVDDILSGVQVVLGTRLKLPTASSSNGLGTGRTDVGVVAAVRKRFDTGWISAESGYLVLGDPADVDFRNVVLWSAGAGRQIASRVFVLGSASGNGALLAGFAAPVEVGAGLGVRVGDSVTLTVLPTVGLSDASPRYAVAVGISSDVLRR